MIIIRNSDLTVTINPFGAELHSIRNQKGEELLWQGDPSVWSGRAPILFPVAGSFKDLKYRYNGVTYDMPQHGFARKRDFRLGAHSETSASFILDGQEENYPFAYCLTVTFTLSGPSLRVAYTVENKGANEMYFGIGAHEAYACPEGIEHYHLEFPDDETLTNHLLTGPLRNYETVEMPLENHRLMLSPQLYESIDTLVFATLKSRSVTMRKNDLSRFVRVDFDGMDNLLLWQKMGAKYFCIEPWTHAPEFIDHDGDITHKPGVRVLKSGESQDIVHTITFG